MAGDHAGGRRDRGRNRSHDADAVPAAHVGWRTYLRSLGPGLVTGASDDDPSGIATYSQAGAQFGYSLAWSALLTLPLTVAIQEICDRAALATGRSLGEVCRQRFGRGGRSVLTVLLVALMVANTANIAADLLAIGAGMNLLHAGPIWVWALIAGAAITVGLVLGSFELISRVFRYLCLSLLAYLVVLFVAHVDWGAVAVHTVVPQIRWSTEYLGVLIAVLGTTLSPYLYFWQTAHRVEEEVEKEVEEEVEEAADDGTADVASTPRAATPLKYRRRAVAEHKKRTSRFDVFVGMSLSNVVMFAIIVATAATLGQNGSTEINSAADAAASLEPIAGQTSKVLFALGFIGTGILAVPVLAAAASVGLAGLHDKEWGFSRSPREAPVFYALVVAGTLGGTALSLLGVNPIRMLIIVAIVNGIATTPFLVTVMLVSADRRLMGDFRNGKLATTFGWLTVAVMTAGTAAVFITGGV